MAYQLTTALDPNDFLDKLYFFATQVIGWTGHYNQLDAQGNRQIAIERKSCAIAIGRYSSSGGDWELQATDEGTVPPTTVVDAEIWCRLATSIDPSNISYDGHPGMDTSDETQYTQVINDVHSAMVEVHFFSPADDDAINIVIRNAANRYVHLSFGNLDKLGMTHSDIGYVIAHYYTWWNRDDVPTSNGVYANNPFGGLHNYLFNGSNTVTIRTPTGVFHPDYGLGNYNDHGDRVYQSGNIFDCLYKARSGRDDFPDGDGNYYGELLNMWPSLQNQPTTGGVQMMTLPCIFNGIDSANNDYLQYLGEFADVRWCSLTDLAAGDEVIFGNDVWKVFPFKKAGSWDNVYGGINPQFGANSATLGVAYKKVE